MRALTYHIVHNENGKSLLHWPTGANVKELPGYVVDFDWNWINFSLRSFTSFTSTLNRYIEIEIYRQK
jgi:hypothetical protein